MFKKADFVLKKRLYEISFPVIRKNLWMSSNIMANLGKKPKTYIATDCYATFEMFKFTNFENIVIQCRENFELENFSSQKLGEMFRFIEFDHSCINMTNCRINPKHYSLIFHPNLEEIIFESPGIHLETLLKLTPNVKEFTFRGITSKNWEKQLLMWNEKHHQNIEKYDFRVTYANDFGSLNKLIHLKNRKIHISLWITAEMDRIQLFKYFERLTPIFSEHGELYLSSNDFRAVTIPWLF